MNWTRAAHTFKILAGHDLLHLDQARQTIDAVKGQA